MVPTWHPEMSGNWHKDLWALLPGLLTVMPTAGLDVLGKLRKRTCGCGDQEIYMTLVLFLASLVSPEDPHAGIL